MKPFLPFLLASALAAVAQTGVFAEAPDNPLFLPDVVLPEDPLVCSAGLRDALSDCHDKIGSVRGYLKTGCKLSNEDAFLALKYFIDDLAGSKSFRDKDDRFQAICCIRDYPCEGSYVFLEHLLADEMEPERRTAAYVLTRMSLGDNARLVRLQAMADTMPTDNWERQEVYQTISNHLQYGSPSHSNQVSLVRFLLNRSLSESKLFDMLDAILCREVPKWRTSPPRAENAAKMIREHPDDAQLVSFFETVRTNTLEAAGTTLADGEGASSPPLAVTSRGSSSGTNAESDPWAGLLDDLPEKKPWVRPSGAEPLAHSSPADSSPSAPPSSPAPEPFQAMLVFPSDLGNETDSSASESRPESEIEQEF